MGEVILCPGRVVTRWYQEEETVWPGSVHDLAPCFFHAVEIDPEFTFGDLCRLLDREDAELLEIVLGEDIVPLLEEARSLAEPFEGAHIEFLRVSNVHEDGRLWREFDGWGPWEEDYEGAWEQHPDWPREGPISVSLTPVNQLLDLPLRYHPELVFRDSDGSEEYRTSVDITLVEFLKAIFFDLTFYGLPAERNEVRAELERRLEEVRRGEAESIPADEVFKELGERLGRSNET